MRQYIMQVAANVNSLMVMQSVGNDGTPEMPQDLHFPLTTLVELDEFEEWLKDEQNKIAKKNVISILAAIGGSDLKHVTWNILSNILADNLAKQVNWKGGGLSGKRPFAAMALKALVIRSVRRNVRGREATDNDVIRHIIRWFNLASDRAGGRQARAERKIQAATGN